MTDYNTENASGWIDEQLEKPYWVIDILPEQVAADAEGQYFDIEEYFLQKPQITKIRRKQLHLLLKLNCYFDFLVCVGDGEVWEVNPAPERMARGVLKMEAAGTAEAESAGAAEAKPVDIINIRIEPAGALAVLRRDDLYVTLYGPGEKLLELADKLAAAEGLFVWQPPEAAD